MEAMRDAWTDARLDDLNVRVGDIGRRMDEGFNHVDSKFDGLRAETKAEFVVVRQEIASLQRLLIQVGGGIIGTMIVGFLGLIATRF